MTRPHLTPAEERLYGHQIDQAHKRYGLDLAPSDVRSIIQQIQNRHNATCLFATLPDTRTNGRFLDGIRQVWKVQSHGKMFTLIFRTSVNEIVTFLPEGQEFYSDGRQRGNVPGR